MPDKCKFTIQNELAAIYEDPRVTLLLGAELTHLDLVQGEVKAVKYLIEGKEVSAKGDIVALGANAIFNAALLLRSGDSHPLVGSNLIEQASKTVNVFLDGVDNFNGSTMITGLSYQFYDGDFRKERAGFLIECSNSPNIRLERNKYRQFLELRVVMEDLPSEHNRVV